jgi:hypothetical protein
MSHIPFALDYFLGRVSCFCQGLALSYLFIIMYITKDMHEELYRARYRRRMLNPC